MNELKNYTVCDLNQMHIFKYTIKKSLYILMMYKVVLLNINSSYKLNKYIILKIEIIIFMKIYKQHI